MALIGSLACEPLEYNEQQGSGGEVVVRVRALTGTKSSSGYSETAVTSLNVYAYRGDQLAAEAYSESSELQLELNAGVEYTFYALANCGEVHAPAAKSDLSVISIEPSQMAMCLREGVSHAFSAGSGSLEISLTRLFARCRLTFDNALENCDYRITSVRVLQQAVSISPFAVSKAVGTTVDGDSAGPSDIAALNSGGCAVFYVPENCQGTLLPDNDDPWEKTPENLPESVRRLCTYLHIEGEWTTGGASADLSLNLMLGSDSCKDFSVIRNTSIDINLTLSDSGVLKSSWKVEMDNFEDGRVLAFGNSEHTVLQGPGWTLIPLTVSPADMAFSASFDGDETPILEAKVEGGKVYVKSIYDGDAKPHATLRVTSWDGRHTSTTDLTLSYISEPLKDYTYRLPKYCGEYGYFHFPNATADSPVVLTLNTRTLTISPGKVPDLEYEYYLDQSTGFEYHVLHNQRKLFVRPVRSGAHEYLYFKQYKSSVGIITHTAAYPGLSVSEGVVCESGDTHYDSGRGLYYDDLLTVCLCDKDGNKLMPSVFETPVELLEFKDLSSSVLINHYRDFLDFFGTPAVSGSTGLGIQTVTLTDEGSADLLSAGDIARVYVYGLSHFTTVPAAFTLSVDMSLQSGDGLSASSQITGLSAFPDQRYLGEYYNYQVAPGAMRSSTLQVDFTSSGQFEPPRSSNVTWSVRHIDGEMYDNTVQAFEDGAADSYSMAASMNGAEITFADFSPTVFPACGMIGLKGTVRNPHSGEEISGYYSMSLILYVSTGCEITHTFGDRLQVTFVPFYEFVDSGCLSNWEQHFPRIRVRSEYNGSSYKLLPDSALGINYMQIRGYSGAEDLEGACTWLSNNLSVVKYEFAAGGGDYTELLLDRSSSLSIDGFEADGSKGYYRLVRQYDVGNIDNGAKYSGLENYIIEAAYESIEDY